MRTVALKQEFSINTDYALTKAACFERALSALSAAGYEVER